MGGRRPERRRILLYVEQGFGDTIQLVRYARCWPDAAKVIVGAVPARTSALRA